MDELFRFMMLRPANLPSPDEVKSVVPGFLAQGAPIESARNAATQYVNGGAFVGSTFSLTFAPIATAVVTAIRTETNKPADLAGLIMKITGKAAADLIASEGFKTEESRLADSLVAMKLLSSSAGGDAPAVAQLIQGYDAIHQVADGRDPVLLRALTYDLDSVRGRPSNEPVPQPPPPRPPPGPDPRVVIGQLDAAISALSGIQASGFSRFAEPTPDVGGGTQPWILNTQTVAALPASVRETLANIGLDLSKSALPMALNALHQQKVQQQRNLELLGASAETIRHQVGTAFLEVGSNGYVGKPSRPFLVGHDSIRPVGIGDLLVVKQHVLRYEGGDLAHVENILKTEHLERDTRRLERTETTIVQETETTKEEESDTQTTDRFSLNRETSDTIKTDASSKACRWMQNTVPSSR